MNSYQRVMFYQSMYSKKPSQEEFFLLFNRKYRIGAIFISKIRKISKSNVLLTNHSPKPISLTHLAQLTQYVISTSI